MDSNTHLEEISDKFQSFNGDHEFTADLEDFAKKLEFDQFLFTIVPDYIDVSKASSSPYFVTNFDKGWMHYYVEKNYIHVDPVFELYIKNRNDTPWVFGRSALKKVPDKSKVMISEAMESGIENLLCFPVHNGLAGTGICSFSYKGKEKDFRIHCNENISFIYKYMRCFVEYLLLKDDVKEKYKYALDPPLTKTEIEILKYMGGGYSRKEIANKRNKSLGTIDKQINMVIRKLNARNAIHAVALALIWKII